MAAKSNSRAVYPCHTPGRGIVSSAAASKTNQAAATVKALSLILFLPLLRFSYAVRAPQTVLPGTCLFNVLAFITLIALAVTLRLLLRLATPHLLFPKERVVLLLLVGLTSSNVLVHVRHRGIEEVV